MATCPACAAELVSRPRFCPECGTRLEAHAPASEVRKTVTVLFADLVGSTALGERLDPETVRTILARYFAELKAICEGHGGTVEKFIGDAVMAVFGIPLLHEDDALRAVRAAAGIRAATRVLSDEFEASLGIGLSVRIGLNSGPVVAGDSASGGTLVTGDPVNTAARLEQAAAPGEILLGERTVRLVRDAVTVEPVPPIDARGKALPVPAWRLVLVRARAAAHARSQAGPLVGREGELEALRAVWAEVRRDRRPQRFAVLGMAGVGKSRLVAEFRAGLEPDSMVLGGTCLSYGEGITYWPLREVVHQAAGIHETNDAGTARAKLEALLAGEPDGHLLASRLAAAIGLSTEAVPGEEIPWATRKLLEALARRSPLVVVWDDLQWAEPGLLDLVEHVADLAREVPFLQLCMARPEFLDARPGWGGDAGTTLRLEPLAADAAERLIDGLPGGTALPPVLRFRISAAAEGNPLYVEEMLGMLVDEGRLVQSDEGVWTTSGDIVTVPVPASINLLLAARLERLPVGERAVAGRASVVGRSFERTAVAELSPEPERAGVGTSLTELVRKALLQTAPQHGPAAAETYLFSHLLIRDAAYEALPKAERAALHERFADWLERIAGDRLVEYEEIVAHHLESAYRYRTELGETGYSVEALGRRAAEALLRAGRAAAESAGATGVVVLLRRALALESLSTRHRLEALELVARWHSRGGSYLDGASAFRDAQLEADRLGDRAAQLRTRIGELDTRCNVDPTLFGEMADASRGAIRELGAAGDPATLAVAWYGVAGASGVACRWDDVIYESGMALAYDRVSTGMLTPLLLGELSFALLMGPIPIREAIDRVRALLAEHHGKRAQASLQVCLAALYMALGNRRAADASFKVGRAAHSELGEPMDAAQDAIYAQMLLRAGDFGAADALATEALRQLTALRAQTAVVTVAAIAGLARAMDGRYDDVDRLLSIAREAEEFDLMTQAEWREVAALVALRDGEPKAAERLARDAVAALADAQAPLDRADAAMVLGHVLRAAGREDEAIEAFMTARALFDKKGATAFVEQVDRVMRREAGRATLAVSPAEEAAKEAT